jgi:hypothetical protein
MIIFLTPSLPAHISFRTPTVPRLRTCCLDHVVGRCDVTLKALVVWNEHISGCENEVLVEYVMRLGYSGAILTIRGKVDDCIRRTRDVRTLVPREVEVGCQCVETLSTYMKDTGLVQSEDIGLLVWEVGEIHVQHFVATFDKFGYLQEEAKG